MFRIRSASLDDLPHILRHRRAMYFEMGCRDDDALDRMEAASERFFREAIPKGTYCEWLAETPDGRVAGGGGIVIVEWPGSFGNPTTRRGWILNVYTEPEFRRQGVAQQIMEAILTWCRSEGFVFVALHASEFGKPLYERMGFTPTNEMRLRLSSP